MPHLIPFRGKHPRVAPDAFIAPNAVLIGDVRVEAEASIWFGAVLRGDDPDHPIIIGRGANVQDQAVVHVGSWGPTVVGPSVTVGHGAVFESCEIGEGSLVGMNAVILPEAVVGRECLLAAGTVILEKASIPDRSVVAGVPGKIRKTLDGSAASWVTRSGEHYRALSREYLAEGIGEER
jgi:carbonic anhydrase/acetyltransferase-like protein (isoleucine patch superfamily)